MTETVEKSCFLILGLLMMHVFFQNCQRLVTNLHTGSQAAAKCDRLVAANCPTNHISALYGPGKNSTPLMGRKKKLAKSSSFDVETLFRLLLTYVFKPCFKCVNELTAPN